MSLKKWSGDAIEIVSKAKVMKGVKPTLTSGDHCIAMYIQAYLDGSISKERLLETMNKMDPRPSKEIIAYAHEQIEIVEGKANVRNNFNNKRRRTREHTLRV